jgi:hypothetical protein
MTINTEITDIVTAAVQPLREQLDAQARTINALAQVQLDNNRLLREIRASQTGTAPDPVEPTPQPGPEPSPPATPTPAGNRISRDGVQLLRGSQPWFAAGFNDASPTGHDSDPPTEAQIDAFYARFPAGTLIRSWAFPNIDLARVRAQVEIAARHGHVVMLALGDGAENAGTPGLYDAAFYESGFRVGFLDHVRRTVQAFIDADNVIWQTMNETAHKRNGQVSTEVVAAFEHAVATTVKEADPSKLVFAGHQDSYHSFSATEDQLRQIMSSPAIDGMDMHSYETYSVSNGNVANRWAKNLRVMTSLNKPLIMGEMGVGIKGSISPQERAAKAVELAGKYRAAGAAGCLYWRLIRPGRYADTGVISNRDSARDPWDGPVAAALAAA